MADKYVAELDHVREVALSGRADLRHWRERLAAENLVPLECDGAAELLISGNEGRFRGVQFRELVICVRTEDGVFLAQAFSSVRFFAWVERVIFHTPYAFAPVAVDSAAIRSEMLDARCASRKPLSSEVDGFDGPVHVPGGRYFRVHLVGITERMDFDPARDTFRTTLPALVESGFTPREWQIRLDARHAKSRTLRRGA